MRTSTPNRRRARVAGIIGALYCAAMMLPLATKADVVSDWNAVATTVLLNKGGPVGIHMAMVHVAIYDAVNAIDRRYAVYAVTPSAATWGASTEAAAAAAAYSLLFGLFPDQQAILDPAYAASLAAVPDGVAKTRGIAIGQEVAAGIIALRANDGRNTVVPYVFGSGPGVYQRTPPAFGNPVNTSAPQVAPFTLLRPSQFRAYGPPDLTSARYAEDFNEVKSLGALNSAKRTAGQTEIGRFHTENPNTFWARNIRDFAATRKLGIGASARLFAMLFAGTADAAGACFDSKYYYNFWRPVTAIPAADTDNNPDTEADAAWSPLANTPPHPEYPAAHGCVAGLVAQVLNEFFGTRHLTMTFTSTVPGSIPHVYQSTDELVDEIINARIYGGMHYRTSGVHGTRLGKTVGKWIARNYFRSVKHRN